MLRPTLCRPPASAISPSSLRVLASAAYSNPKEDATSKDANPKGLESLSFPMLNFGLGTIVACAGFATMLSELSADIKHNHSEFTTKIDHVKENFADAMISPEERNAATVGALLSLSPPRGAGGIEGTGAGTPGMEALRPTLWRQSDGLVTRRFVG